ncbi:MAG TPA: hypothetical protein VKB92_02080, partial [Myxococcales bacterium]|nr:hypothetical protein [Myxococcales bacterium]
VYSLGVILFQLATGKLPFPGQSFGEVLIGHLQLPPPDPVTLNPLLPQEWSAIVLKCLAKKQEDRYQNMEQLRQAIGGCMDHLGIGHELPIATADEMAMSRSNPGLPQQTPAPRPLTRKPARPTPAPNPARQQLATPARPTSPPVAVLERAPERSHLPLIAGVVVVLTLALAGIGYMVWDSRRQFGETMRHEAERTQREAERQAAAARAAESARPPEIAQNVTLFVWSDPGGADVEASWNGGKKQGVAPFNFDVPKNTKVHVEFRKAGYLPNPQVSDVFADASQTVQAKLVAEPKVLAATPAPTGRKAKKDKKVDQGSEETIKIDF